MQRRTEKDGGEREEEEIWETHVRTYQCRRSVIEVDNKNERRQQVLPPAAGRHTTGTAAGAKTQGTTPHTGGPA
jgi:hypothetical protein